MSCLVAMVLGLLLDSARSIGSGDLFGTVAGYGKLLSHVQGEGLETPPPGTPTPSFRSPRVFTSPHISRSCWLACLDVWSIWRSTHSPDCWEFPVGSSIAMGCEQTLKARFWQGRGSETAPLELSPNCFDRPLYIARSFRVSQIHCYQL
jgi:hypothetical protein